MNDYISREDVQGQIVKAAEKCQIKLFDKSVNAILQILQNMPAADVQPVKRGEWKYYKNTGIFDIHKCSVCATPFELPMDIVPSSVFCFCPHCGARMKED